MAAEAVASTSSTTHSVTSVTSWSPMMNMNYQAALHHYMAYLHYGLPYPTSPWVTALVPPPPHPQSASSSSDRTGSVSSRKRKAGTAAVPEAATAAANLPSAAASAAAGDSTRLFLRGRNGITYRPYSDISLGNSQSGSGLPGEYFQPKKPRHLDGRRGTNGLNGHKQGQVGSLKKAQIIQPDRGCTIGNLFPEVLSIIFEYLDEQSKGRVAQVSKLWRDAAYKKSVWKGMTARLHLTKSTKCEENHLFKSLVERGIKHVQILGLRKSSLKELVSGIPNLQSLNLSGCYNLSDGNIDMTFNKKVTNLKTLDLSFCKEITDNSVARIATHCDNLETVDLDGCSKITDQGLFYLANLPRLKSLNLKSCRQISDKGLQYLSNPNNGSNLESLSLQDCQKLTDDSLRSIAQGLPNLKTINLSFCVSITDTGLKSLAKMANLEAINLRTCDNVSDIGIGFLAENEKLNSIDVSFCGNISDSSLKHMASSNSLAQSLRTLSISTCAVTDEGLVRLAKSMTKLQELHMGQCVKISDKSLEVVASHMKELTVIDLYGHGQGISEAAIEKLRKQLPKLQTLKLSL